MIKLGNRLVLKIFKGIAFLTIALCSACCVFILQSVQYTRAPKPHPQNDKADGLMFQKFTQILYMPGGDDIPSSPPWTLPSVPILREPQEVATNSSKRYITTKFFMSPGQGNLMFQYASVFGIARRHNATVVIPEGLLIRRAFSLGGATVVSYRMSVYLLKNWKRKAYANCCEYYPETENLVNGTNFALYGYFQSYKYFHNEDLELRQAVREQFRFLPDVETAARGHLNMALEKWTKSTNRTRAPVLVGVHVRHGLDVTWNTRNQQHGHTVAGKSYFLKAMSYFRAKFRNVLFIFCSDDFYWVQQNFGNLKDVFIIRSKIREVDMCVLSLCSHTIMSQGTFSWWAAYLAGGDAIYFDGWPRPGSELAAMLKKEDFFLPEWIPMQ